MQADVIIPVYRPTEKLLRLLEMLKKQTYPVHQVILINTEKKYFDDFARRNGLEKRFGDFLLVRHISREEFDHGKTRNYGVSLSETPYFVMMTDDAVPVNEDLVRELMSAFENPGVGVSYARQIADKGCGVLESYTRSFNYPEHSCMKSARNLEDMGIKAFFASNVCAAYRREFFDELNGFTDHTIFNEDMIYARGLLDAGYLIAYQAGAMVFHSHNYSALRQFRRNFDLGVSHALYPQVFAHLPAESEGIRLVKKSCGYLFSVGRPWLIVKLFWQSGFKYMGYFLGKRHQKLPRFLVRAFSLNRQYWAAGEEWEGK